MGVEIFLGSRSQSRSQKIMLARVGVKKICLPESRVGVEKICSTLTPNLSQE